MPAGDYKPKKLFTLEEANRTLPLVSRIIGDIVHAHTEILGLNEEVEKFVEEGRSVRAEETRGRMLEIVDHVQDLVDELDMIGCVCKDPRLGLVDYPALIEDRVVFLCWKLGEKDVRYWHELEAGFAGRKTVRGSFA